MAGIMFSPAMDCRTLGVPYRVARQLDTVDMYRADRRSTPEKYFKKAAFFLLSRWKRIILRFLTQSGNLFGDHVVLQQGRPVAGA